MVIVHRRSVLKGELLILIQRTIDAPATIQVPVAIHADRPHRRDTRRLIERETISDAMIRLMVVGPQTEVQFLISMG